MTALSMLFLVLSSTGQADLVASSVPEGPSIDGVLNDPAWESANAVTCRFVQYGPDYGSPMTEDTEVMIVYDDRFIYFGFQMDDPDPRTMMEALTPRDNYVTGEWIAVLLDTWGNGREAASFEVSLANSQMDSKVSPYGHWDYSWDAVWESATATNPRGWSAEMAIPFSCLRFPAAEAAQNWTVNFQRILGKTRENGWFVLSTSVEMAQLENFPQIEGITGIRGSLGAEIRPYGSTRALRPADPGEWDSEFDAGVDAKLGVTSDIVADLAFNPDFGQVESDAAEMNLSHFELFLDERRPFFLESQETFEMPFNMFYSRRIGAAAPGGGVVPIRAGVKLSGSLGGGFRFGFLDAVTAGVSQDTVPLVPGANFGVFRTVREFGSYGSIGISAVSRDVWEQDGFDQGHNRAIALDGAVLAPGDHLIRGAFAGSFNTGIEDGNAWAASIERVRSTLSYSAGWERIGKTFDVNGTGFTTVTGGWNSWGSISKTYMPEETFSQLSVSAYGSCSRLDTGEQTGAEGTFEANVSLKSGAYMGGQVTHSGETFDPYEGPEGVTYGDRTSANLWAGTNRFDCFSVSGSAGFGGFDCEGSFHSYSLALSVTPTQSLDLNLSGNTFETCNTWNYNWAADEWDSRSSRWRSLILRASYMFTPDMSIRLFSQYSRFLMDYSLTGESESSGISANALLSWQYMPGSMFYFLVENRTEEEGGRFNPPDLGVYGKLTWFLAV